MNLIQDRDYDVLEQKYDNLSLSDNILKPVKKAIKLENSASARSNTISNLWINNRHSNSNNKNKSESEEFTFKLPDDVWTKLVKKENQWIFKHRINEKMLWIEILKQQKG